MGELTTHTLYENFVLEAKLTDLLNTKLATRSLMTIDNSLSENVGMTKKINTYTYAGTVEKMATLGATNTVRGVLSYTTSTYDVDVWQQVFDYYDEQFMTDNKVVDYSMEGASTVMVNDMNTKYFAELAKATTSQTYAKGGYPTYETVVDAIAKMNLEDESGLFLIIGTDLKAAIRKDADFKAANLGEIIHSGQIGNISCVPVIVSKLCPAKTAYLATKEAVTLFTKKDSEVEQERHGEERKNTVIMRKVNLVALTDNTKVVKITEATA